MIYTEHFIRWSHIIGPQIAVLGKKVIFSSAFYNLYKLFLTRNDMCEWIECVSNMFEDHKTINSVYYSIGVYWWQSIALCCTTVIVSLAQVRLSGDHYWWLKFPRHSSCHVGDCEVLTGIRSRYGEGDQKYITLKWLRNILKLYWVYSSGLCASTIHSSIHRTHL